MPEGQQLRLTHAACLWSKAARDTCSASRQLVQRRRKPQIVVRGPLRGTTALRLRTHRVDSGPRPGNSGLARLRSRLASLREARGQTKAFPPPCETFQAFLLSQPRDTDAVRAATRGR